ncbi:DNA-binding helix-turn-helix protein [uncultured Dysgonomonas sp.]|uniref:DNA-binding helix-turn-helix protein n=1 Tax=uncultured Dysgonomonas sp. TaxID=206096 RepID=A0A212K4A3_9BACT|nr:helix-turn-helix transcriptional regulator [Dysgonomonas mossii]SBW06447.1 DNA-binding helix-turn-helix protein [uncultured Dysgonomonas sp.]
MELRIKEVCKEKGILQKDLAEKLGITDIALRASLKGNPTIGTLEKVASVLKVPFTDLFEQPQQNIITCPHCNGKIKVSKDE